MTMEECLKHPLWNDFTTYMYTTGKYAKHQRWEEGRNYWNKYWECFIVGALVGTKATIDSMLPKV